jgi:hypothetical protein
MNCKTAKRHFSEFFDSRLPVGAADQLDDHLNDCRACSDAYAAYDRLFTALRSVPMVRTDASAPLPETATAFVRAGSQPSFVRRFASAAAVFLLVGAAAHFGYKLGVKSDIRLGNESDGDAVAAPQTAELAGYLPNKEAGERVRRLHDSTRGLAYVMSRAPSVSDPKRAADAMSRVMQLAPIYDDGEALRSMDERRLGNYEQMVHDCADETLLVLHDVKRKLLAPGDPRRKLREAWGVFDQSGVATRLVALGEVARRYEPTPYEDPISRGVDPIPGGNPDDKLFEIGCLRFLAGQTGDAVQYFGLYSQAQPNSPLRAQAEALSVQLSLGKSWTERGRVTVSEDAVPFLSLNHECCEKWQKVFELGGSSLEVELTLNPTAVPGRRVVILKLNPSSAQQRPTERPAVKVRGKII